MHETLARRLLRAAICDDGFAADHTLPRDHKGNPTGGQIDVGTAAEADDAEALSGDDVLALAQIADDAPCDEAGDLHDGDIAGAIGRRNADGHSLVVLARLVEAGVD